MTFKERYNKIKKTAVEFWNENKSLIIAAGGFIAGTFVTYKIMKSTTPINEINVPQVTYTPPVCTPPANDTNNNIVPWDEETMRDNWDWVCELASNMELDPGESYYIENAAGSHGDAGASIGSNLVCHMYDGEEVYPDDVEEYEELYDPDNEDEEEDKEEPEDDEDEYIEIKVNEDDPAVKDITRKFVALINTNAVSVRRKEND